MGKLGWFLYGKFNTLSPYLKWTLTGLTTILFSMLLSSGYLLFFGILMCLTGIAVDIGIIGKYREWKKEYDAFEENSKH